jgi:hypothetical protein
MLETIEENLKQNSLLHLPFVQDKDISVQQIQEKYSQLLDELETEKKKLLKTIDNLQKKLKDTFLNTK